MKSETQPLTLTAGLEHHDKELCGQHHHAEQPKSIYASDLDTNKNTHDESEDGSAQSDACNTDGQGRVMNTCGGAARFWDQ